jgi:hypothetical protein
MARRRKALRKARGTLRMATKTYPGLARRYQELAADPALMADPAARNALKQAAARLDHLACELDLKAG